MNASQPERMTAHQARTVRCYGERDRRDRAAGVLSRPHSRANRNPQCGHPSADLFEEPHVLSEQRRVAVARRLRRPVHMVWTSVWTGGGRRRGSVDNPGHLVDTLLTRKINPGDAPNSPCAPRNDGSRTSLSPRAKPSRTEPQGHWRHAAQSLRATESSAPAAGIKPGARSRTHARPSASAHGNVRRCNETKRGPSISYMEGPRLMSGDGTALRPPGQRRKNERYKSRRRTSS